MVSDTPQIARTASRRGGTFGAVSLAALALDEGLLEADARSLLGDAEFLDHDWFWLPRGSRNRLAAIHRSSIAELEQGLAPELVEELERLSLPFSEDVTPSEAELRIAQAQLVGWLEGLFHGIQTAIYAQQMAARAQFEQIRRALPPGMTMGTPAADPAAPGTTPGEATEEPRSGGMYL